MENAASISVTIPVSGGHGALPGEMIVPQRAQGLIVFAHGSGSSRLSPRNRFVAQELRRAGFATLLFDLLSEAEAADRANVFDIPFLGARVGDALAWVAGEPAALGLPVGLFGASTGAAAALVAAAARPDAVTAVVSRGGRPDLAGAALAQVRAATLLIVGGADHGVIELNEAALAQLACVKRLEIVPGATHLFEEPGALDAVVTRAVAWFAQHLTAPGP